jgi:hypothetical protein
VREGRKSVVTPEKNLECHRLTLPRAGEPNLFLHGTARQDDFSTEAIGIVPESVGRCLGARKP